MLTLLHDIGLKELVNQEGRPIKNIINCVKQNRLQMDNDPWRTKLFNDSRQENGNNLRT